MKILDTYKEFTYTYYESCDKLKSEYDKMFNIIKADGHALASNEWSLDTGILLENGNEVIAGIFLNINKYKGSILILATFVEEQYRQQGIYKKMHKLLNNIGNDLGKKAIYAYIHRQNNIMNEHIIEKNGYEPVMTLVRRGIK
jgi:RimJ/RimL family protein N-acetyltransferase